MKKSEHSIEQSRKPILLETVMCITDGVSLATSLATTYWNNILPLLCVSAIKLSSELLKSWTDF